MISNQKEVIDVSRWFCCYYYGEQFFDPGLVLYIYESPPGYGILALRVIAWIYFSYACFFTVKHYPEKSKFYYPFYIFYTIWYDVFYTAAGFHGTCRSYVVTHNCFTVIYAMVTCEMKLF